MKNISLFCLAIGFVLSLAGCSKDPAKTTPFARPISNKTLQANLATLSDTLSGKWNVMLLSDSVKIAQMEELVKSLPTSTMSAAEKAKFQQAIRRLPAGRYNQRTMADSDLIDAYDVAHDSVYQALLAYLPPPDVETGNATTDSLRGEIKDHHEEVVFYRARYDMTAKEINALLRCYRKRLPKLDAPFDTLKPAPLFQWVDKPAAGPVTGDAVE